MPDVWGGDATVRAAVQQAFADPKGQLGSMVARADDPRLVALGLVPPGATGLRLVFARAEVLRGKPQACFLQILPTQDLVDVSALGGTHLTLVAPDGTRDGNVPEMSFRPGAAPLDEYMVAGWLIERLPLLGLGGDQPIAQLVLAQDLNVALAQRLRPAIPLLMTFAGVLVFLALGAAALLARRFSRPIVALAGAARRVADGELEVSVAARPGGDEIDRLGATFNRMTEGLRERERIKSTFKRYLAPDIVEYLLAHPERRRSPAACAAT